MRDIINKGQVMSIIIYALYGITTLIGFGSADGVNGSYAIAAIFFWIVTLCTMVGLRVSNLRHSMAYKALYILSVCIYAVFIQLFFRSVYLVFIVYAILWLTVITFLDKKCFHSTIVIQSACLLFLVLIPGNMSGLSDYTMVSWIFSTVGFLGADWIACIIINILLQLDEETMEHERGLDDLLDIVESKHEEAVQATMSKSNFLSNMSHELRTPLNAIIGLDEMILRETDDKNILEYAGDIQTSGRMMLSLVNDILDLSKIESGRMTLVPVDFDMQNLIKDIGNMIEPKAKSKNLEFIIYADKDIMGCYHGDDVRIKQILVNLLNNAAKYTEKGSVTLKITGEKAEDKSKLSFCVKDTGMGIKEEDLAKLKTGLGITIVSSLLKLMGSELKVESVYGEGSEFSFEIMLKKYRGEYK